MVYPSQDQRTELQRSCAIVTQRIVESRDVLLERIEAKFPIISDAILILDERIIVIITELLQEFIQERASDLPAPILNRIQGFMRPATDAVCIFIYGLISSHAEKGMLPETLEKKRDAVAQGCKILAGYPQEFSANVKQILAANLTACFQGNDLSDDLYRGIREEFVPVIRNDDALIEKISHRSHCPAWEGAEEFARVVFDIFLAAYRHKFNELSKGSETMPLETICALLQRTRLLAHADML